MKKQLIVTDRTEIASALEWIEQRLKQQIIKNQEDRLTGTLICEELMIRLFDAGNTNLTIEVKGLIEPYVEIVSEGVPLELRETSRSKTHSGQATASNSKSHGGHAAGSDSGSRDIQETDANAGSHDVQAAGRSWKM